VRVVPFACCPAAHARTTAARREQRVCDPADAAVLIANLPPVLELLHDLDGQADAAEHPQHFVIGAGALAHLDAVGLEADETRQRQPGGADAIGLRRAWPRLRVQRPARDCRGSQNGNHSSDEHDGADPGAAVRSGAVSITSCRQAYLDLCGFMRWFPPAVHAA
jgi:hypothetical protein